MIEGVKRRQVPAVLQVGFRIRSQAGQKLAHSRQRLAGLTQRDVRERSGSPGEPPAKDAGAESEGKRRNR